MLMCGRMLAFAATFFIPVVLVRIFDPAEFGTYKQLFLIQSTVFLIAQCGMASSLYYFLPLGPAEAGRYVANSLLFLAIAGLSGLALLSVAAPMFARWMNNGALPKYLPWIGLYLFLQMTSASLEMVLISRHKYSWASASYALSDLARAAAFILPALVFRQLEWLLKGAVVVTAIRVVVVLFYFRKEFGDGFRLDRILFRRQMAYAVPFGLAIVVEIIQGTLPQYVVSYLTDPVTFAIFSIGCLQIPLIDFAASPASDVMMVTMQEYLSKGDKQAVLDIWHDTTWKLALFFFPLTGLMIAAGHEIIVLLFTSKYTASGPIFIAWSMTIVLTVFQVDGVMRVFAQTRLLLLLNLVRLALIAGLIKASLGTFHLIGPVLVILLATLTFKAAGLLRMKGLLHVSAAKLLPWRDLASLTAVSAIAGVVASLAKAYVQLPHLAILLIVSAVYAVTYAVLVWRFNLLSESEKGALVGWLRRRSGGIYRIPDYRRA